MEVAAGSKCRRIVVRGVGWRETGRGERQQVLGKRKGPTKTELNPPARHTVITLLLYIIRPDFSTRSPIPSPTVHIKIYARLAYNI